MSDGHPSMDQLAMQVAPFHPKLFEALDAMYPSHMPEQRLHMLLIDLMLLQTKQNLRRGSHTRAPNESLANVRSQPRPSSTQDEPGPEGHGIRPDYGERILNLGTKLGQPRLPPVRRKYTKEEKAGVRDMRDIGACPSCRRRRKKCHPSHARPSKIGGTFPPAEQSGSNERNSSILSHGPTDNIDITSMVERRFIMNQLDDIHAPKTCVHGPIALANGSPIMSGSRGIPAQEYNNGFDGPTHKGSDSREAATSAILVSPNGGSTTGDRGVGETFDSFLHDTIPPHPDHSPLEAYLPSESTEAMEAGSPRGPRLRPPDGWEQGPFRRDLPQFYLQDFSHDNQASDPFDGQWPKGTIMPQETMRSPGQEPPHVSVCRNSPKELVGHCHLETIPLATRLSDLAYLYPQAVATNNFGGQAVRRSVPSPG